MGEDYVLAADLGGTNLRTAAVSRTGSILHQRKVPTPQTSEPNDIIQAITSEANSCIHAMALKPVAFGIAAAALVDSAGTRVLSSPNLPELNGVDLSATVADIISTKVSLDNDATSAAIGENWLGAAAGSGNSICVTLGTGVGGGIIIGGQPFRGSCGTAGEVGHICVEPNGVKCGCGSIGCVEQYASATAIVRIAKELRAETDQYRDKEWLTAADVYAAACASDKVAVETFRIMGRYLGIALAGLINVLNPRIIVLGGGASGAWDFFIDHVRSEVEFRAFAHPADLVEIAKARLDDNAGILGAAYMAFNGRG